MKQDPSREPTHWITDDGQAVPLAELTREQAIDALRQMLTLWAADLLPPPDIALR